jgi:uncharacterized protein (DUF4415 family)
MTKLIGGRVKRTRGEAKNVYYVVEAMQRLEYDLHTHLNHLRRIPLEWETIHRERTYHKTRITMRVDRDVLKFFRSLGPGYQPRINDVLRAFMHARLSGLIDGEETLTEYRDARWADRKRPVFGDMRDEDGE